MAHNVEEQAGLMAVLVTGAWNLKQINWMESWFRREYNGRILAYIPKSLVQPLGATRGARGRNGAA